MGKYGESTIQPATSEDPVFRYLIDTFNHLRSGSPSLPPQPPPLPEIVVDVEPAIIQLNKNARTNLLSLPDDILVLVVRQLYTRSPSFLTHKCPPPCPLTEREYESWVQFCIGIGWVRVTHVCRRLRAIVLELPTLWTSVSFAHRHPSRWLPDVLRRSRSQPLSLHFPEYGLSEEEQETCAAILGQPSHLPRIEHVQFAVWDCWLPVIRVILTSDAPQLETLELGRLDPDTRDVFVLPQPLFDPESNSAPRLSYLKLAQSDFSWSSLHRFSTLTTLILSRPCIPVGDEYEVQYVVPSDDAVSYPPTRRTADVLGQSMDEVVACLRALPHLRALTLQNALPLWNPTVPSIGQPQTLLPELRWLVIEQYSLYPIFFLLALLDAPHLFFCSLKYRAIARPTGTDLQARYAPLAKFLSRFASGLTSPIGRVNLEFGIPDIKLHVYCRHRARRGLCLQITIRMAIVPKSPDDWPNRHYCVEPILAALPLGHLVRLDIADCIAPEEEESHHTVDFAFWSRIYEWCASASRVSATGMALVPLVPLLTHRNLRTWAFSDPPPEPRTPAFPHLRSLDVVAHKLGHEGVGVVQCLTSQRRRRKGQRSNTIAFIKAVRVCLESRLEKLPKLEHLKASVSMWIRPESDSDIVMFNKVFEEEAGALAETVDPLTVQRERYRDSRGVCVPLTGMD